DFCNFHVLIIDNGSTDGSFEEIQKIAAQTQTSRKIVLLKNSENLGYGKNLLRLFDECKTKYLVVDYDEDSVLEDGIKQLDLFIRKNIDENPLLVCPRAIIDGKLYRGKNSVSSIKFIEHRQASNYLSGVCYNTEEARKILPLIGGSMNH